MDWLKLVHASQSTPSQAMNPGDEVRVWYRILEHGKERLGQFEGTILRLRGTLLSKTFTVRRVTFGEGVERVFPLDAKVISRVEVLRKGAVKRSRLYFLRTLVGKSRIVSEDATTGAIRPDEAVPIVDKTAEAEAPAPKA